MNDHIVSVRCGIYVFRITKQLEVKCGKSSFWVAYFTGKKINWKLRVYSFFGLI